MHEEYNNAETSEITGIGLERSNCKGGSLAPSVSKINHMERFRRLHQRRVIFFDGLTNYRIS